MIDIFKCDFLQWEIITGVVRPAPCESESVRALCVVFRTLSKLYHSLPLFFSPVQQERAVGRWKESCTTASEVARDNGNKNVQKSDIYIRQISRSPDKSSAARACFTINWPRSWFSYQANSLRSWFIITTMTRRPINPDFSNERESFYKKLRISWCE